MANKRALLLGCATGGLSGVTHDVESMGSWLHGLGFQLDIRQGVSATREGIFDGLGRLERDSADSDVAVIYYTGHGGYSQIRGPSSIDDRTIPRAVQYLVPTDHDKEENFRGIFRAELSLAVGRLSRTTSNITVILDCCHSTDMVREDDDLLKGVIEPWNEGIEAHLAWMVSQGHDLERLPMLRDPHVVLLSACEATRQAYEITRRSDGARCGLFTDCLLEVVGTLSSPDQVTWHDLMRRVADRALRHRSHQRPQASGPAARFMFLERTERRIGALTLHRRDHICSLGGGEAAGVMAGDRYRIIDPLRGADESTISHVEVARIDAGSAVVRDVEDGNLQAQSGMVALPHPGGPVHLRCRLEGAGPTYDELLRRVAEIAGMAVAGDDTPGAFAFLLRVTGRAMQVFDADGKLLRQTWHDTDPSEPIAGDDRMAGFIDELRRIARGTELLRLARQHEGRATPRPLGHALDWGTVGDGGERQSRPMHGANLTVGDRVFLELRNFSPWPIRVSVFDVGIGRTVTLLNANEPEGIDLGVGETETIGAGELRALSGLPLGWPSETPSDSPREESLVIFISRRCLPLASWETSPWCDRANDMRDLDPMPRGDVDDSYVIKRITFRLHPKNHYVQ